MQELAGRKDVSTKRISTEACPLAQHERWLTQLEDWAGKQRALESIGGTGALGLKRPELEFKIPRAEVDRKVFGAVLDLRERLANLGIGADLAITVEAPRVVQVLGSYTDIEHPLFLQATTEFRQKVGNKVLMPTRLEFMAQSDQFRHASLAE